MSIFRGIMSASFNGYIEIIKLLLEKEIKINLLTKDGWSALILASLNGKTEAVKLLLDKGANPDLKSNEGKTAYDYAKNDDIKTLLARYLKK